jgi:hypothetical protein
MSGFVGIEPVAGSDREERKAFLQCLVTRMRYGPTAAADLDLEPDPDANPFPVEFTSPELDLEAARQLVAELAASCNPGWQALYRIIRD